MRLLNILSFVIALMGHNASALDCPDLVVSSDQIETAGYSRGILWRIESVDGRVSHVFGTIHISDPRVTDLPKAVIGALNSSNSFGMEVLLDFETIARMSSAMYYGSGGSLKSNLDAELFEGTVSLLGRYGVTAAAAQKLKPWAAYTTLSVPPGQTTMPLDLFLLAVAQQAGKATFGLETIDEQVAVFDDLTMSDQRELLTQTVCHYDKLQAEIEKMIEHYLARDLAAMMRMSMRYQSPLQDRFMDVLLWQRNVRMTERMIPHLQKGGAFIAIGALHLPGVGGVLDLLRERGYSATALQ